jgi:hypothetical protein
LNHSVLAFSALAFAVAFPARSAGAQVDYRNLDAGRPTRIADATPTERRALEISLTSARFERLTLGRYRLQLEPRVAYGILPRTEISLRAPVYFYERAVSPRAGLGGFGIGGEHQVAIETLRLPAIAFSGEAFIPTGPNAVRTAFSGKALVTRTFSAFRAHLNGTVASFSYRVPPGVEPIIPPFHGPCSISDAGGAWARASCSSPAALSSVAAAVEGEVRTEASWTAGLAIDHSFPLQSLMIVADVFRQKYGGIGRAADWTAEVGARKQVTRSLVVDGGLGRLFTGESRAWFLVFGTTFTRAGKL